MGLVRFRDGSGPIRVGYSVNETLLDVTDELGSATQTLQSISAVPDLVADRSDLETVPVERVETEPPVTPSKIVRLDGCYEHDLTDEGFLPCGRIVTPLGEAVPDRLDLGLQHDGEVVDMRMTESLWFTVAELVRYASRVMTLTPSNLITTGRPTKGGPKLEDEGEIEAWIGGLGRVRTDIEHVEAA